MFLNAVQPGLVSLFSSTGSHPLQLFSKHEDQDLVSDSVIHLLHDRRSAPLPKSPAAAILPPALNHGESEEGDSSNLGYELDQTVLHIQSPDIKRTFIECPKLVSRTGANFSRPSQDLGLKLPWIHFQVRNLGREWSFEVGIVDRAGMALVVRCSTFQKQPRLILPSVPSQLPLLLLPLSFPTHSSYTLTTWSTIALHLPTIMNQATSLSIRSDDADGSDSDLPIQDVPSNFSQSLPHARFSHVSYVRIYATCRLRRIWFSEGGPSQRPPWEFELYAAED